MASSALSLLYTEARLLVSPLALADALVPPSLAAAPNAALLSSLLLRSSERKFSTPEASPRPFLRRAALFGPLTSPPALVAEPES